MIDLPNIDDIKNELRGDNINNIINIDAMPRHMHIFFLRMSLFHVN